MEYITYLRNEGKYFFFLMSSTSLSFGLLYVKGIESEFPRCIAGRN